ncbi:MAG: TetR family transcriptional regulator [Bacteroidetes bacterium]|nr:TetR family transcriptional regulator [Bacteroidota bacterium]
MAEQEISQQAPVQETTEQKIFDAAHELFVQKGLDGAKMQEIADKAGINKALLHYYYRTKEKLFEMVAKAIIHQGVPVFRKKLESDKPLEEKIAEFVDSYIDLIRLNPFMPVFIISEMNKHPQHFFEKIMPAELPKPQKFIRQIEEAVAEGRIRPVNPQHLVVNIMALCAFPFVARPMMQMVLGLNAHEIEAFFKQRKTEVTEFIFAALRPES